MTEDQILLYRAGKIEVHLPRVELVQCAASPPRAFSGPGRLYQLSDRSIRLTVYPEPFDRHRREDLPVGTQVPAHHYFDMRAAAPGSRRRWCSDSIHLEVDDVFVPSWRPIDEPLRLLRREDHLASAAEGSHLTGYIFRSLRIAANARTQRTTTRPAGWSEAGEWNILRFRIDHLQIDIRQETDYTVVDAASEELLPQNFEQRLLETVCFVFGRPVSWSATVSTSEALEVTRLSGEPPDDSDTHFRQPIPHTVTGAGESIAELFRRYYLHVLRDCESRWHPLSLWWAEVLRAGSREMESLVLTASIAVEGICRAIIEAGDLPEGVDTIAAEVASEWQQRVAAELERIECPAANR